MFLWSGVWAPYKDCLRYVLGIHGFLNQGTGPGAHGLASSLLPCGAARSPVQKLVEGTGLQHGTVPCGGHLLCATASASELSPSSNTGALMIRIGFWGFLYYM